MTKYWKRRMGKTAAVYCHHGTKEGAWHTLVINLGIIEASSFLVRDLSTVQLEARPYAHRLFHCVGTQRTVCYLLPLQN
jgi:hypothetical protein